MSFCVSISVCLSVYLYLYLYLYLSICLSFYLSIYLFYLSISISIYLQVWKRSYSARLLQILNLTTTKTKQCCETSSIFELDNVKNKTIFKVDNIKNETVLRDFLQKWKVECRADGLVPMRFAIFPLYLSKVLRLPRKSDARSYEVLHLSRKIISPKLKIWCSKMQPLSGNQRPDLLTSLMNMSLVLHLPRDMHLSRSSSNVPRLPSFLDMLQNPHVLLTFKRCTIPCACHAKRHLNVQKWSEDAVSLTFWLPTTTACTFSTCQLPKVVRRWCALHWLGNVLRATTACNFSALIWPHGSASAALASLLFDPLEPQIIGKTLCFATFLPFACLHLLSSLSFSSLIFSLLLFSSLTLPTSAFPSVHIVGSLTSKLPSIILYNIMISIMF